LLFWKTMLNQKQDCKTAAAFPEHIFQTIRSDMVWLTLKRLFSRNQRTVQH